MQNSVLSQVSQLYNNGYTDNVPELPMQMGSRLITNDNSFYEDSNIYPSQDQLDGVFALCSQVPINYQSGASSVMSMKRFNHPCFEDTEVACNRINAIYDSKEQLQLSQLQVDNFSGRMNQYGNQKNTRKRPIENVNVFQQRSPEMIVEDKWCESNWPANNKMSFCFQGQHKDNFGGKDLKEAHKDKGPARRSQKLADRITALQKLVSPYGKTDTASVLQEASVFIKTVQVQIEKMFRTLNSPLDDENSQQGIGEKQYNLRNKGLCLVPLSRTQKLMEDTMHQYSPMIDSSMSPDNLATFM